MQFKKKTIFSLGFLQVTKDGDKVSIVFPSMPLSEVIFKSNPEVDGAPMIVTGITTAEENVFSISEDDDGVTNNELVPVFDKEIDATVKKAEGTIAKLYEVNFAVTPDVSGVDILLDNTLFAVSFNYLFCIPHHSIV